MNWIFRNLRSERGASLAEYALLTVLFAVPSIIAVEQVTVGLSQNFEEAAGSGVAVDQSNPGSTTTVPDDPTTTVAPATTSTTSPASTTAAPTTTTTTTTTAPPPTTTVPPTTTTTAAPGGEGTPVDPAPIQQATTVNSDGGWIRFESNDGEISIDDYDLNRNWRGSYSIEDDHSMVVWLWHRYDGSTVTITAWIDDDGYLQTSVI